MLKWLRNKLRSWLVDEEDDDCYLDYKCKVGLDIRILKGLVTGVVGNCLLVYPIDTAMGGQRLVGEGDAMNRKRFWKLFERFRGTSKYEWEDGTPFKVEK